MRLLAAIAARAGRADEAERLLERAISIAPDFLSAILDLGLLRKDRDRFTEALECFDRAIALAPADAQAHFLRGATLAPASFTFEAIEAYEKCLELQPTHAGALLGRGHLLKGVGRYNQAVASYDACIRERPDSGEAYWSLANLKTYRFSDEAITEMERRVRGSGLNVQSEVNFLFALGKAWEDRGDYERAWAYYHEGNTKQRADVAYDPVRTEAANDRLIATFSGDFLASRAGVGLPDPAPIFIVGLPRSGSTLLEQILASHSQVEGTGELPYVPRVANIAGPQSRRRHHLPRGGAGARSEPLSLARRGIPGLCAAAPPIGYAAIHRQDAQQLPAGRLHVTHPADRPDYRCARHPLDACLGCYRQLFAKGQEFTYDLTEIGEYYLQYQRMMDHWATVLPGRVLTVQYEEVVADFENQVRRLLEFCGLPWEDACLRFYESERPIRTPSAEQVRQPIYDRSVGYWRNYAQYLDELVTVIEPIRARYRRYEPAGTA
jgi:tetratricopeptide (TPR) repeat protein